MIAAKIKATQGSEGTRRATEIPWGGTPKEVNLHQGAAAAPPDPEVLAKAARRRFTAEYKLRVLTLVDACNEPGCLGKLLRREGALCIKSQHLAKSARPRRTFRPRTQEARS